MQEILTREEPFSHHDDYVTFKRAVCFKSERPPIPPSCLPSLKYLIEACWQKDSTKRPSFAQIIPMLDIGEFGHCQYAFCGVKHLYNFVSTKSSLMRLLRTRPDETSGRRISSAKMRSLGTTAFTRSLMPPMDTVAHHNRIHGDTGKPSWALLCEV